MCLLITVHSNVTNLCIRNQSKDTGNHTKSGTKDRYDCQLTSGDHRCHALLDRSLNLYILHRKIRKCLKSLQHRDLIDKLTELVCPGRLITEQGNFMLN